MEFEFVNKIWLSNMGKGKTKKIIMLILCGIILLLHLFQALMGGFDSVNWYVGIGVPILLFCIGMMGSNRGGYTNALCKLELNENLVKLTYPSLDRYDNGGVHKEIQTISKNDIFEIQYSQTLSSFRLLGMYTIRSVVAGNAEVFMSTPINCQGEIIIYPQKNQIAGILSAFETILGLCVRQMDEQSL